MSIELGSLATATKSAGVSVIPIDSINAASAAVKYWVVKNSNVLGRFNAMAVNNTVHKGNRVVAPFAILVYASNILPDKDLLPSEEEDNKPLSAELCSCRTHMIFGARSIIFYFFEGTTGRRRQ